MKTLYELAKKINVRPQTITFVLYHIGVNKYYTDFEIEKKYGGVRKISAPTSTLKIIQKNLLTFLEKEQKKSFENKYSYAFEKGKTITNNAFVHKNKKYVINIDLKDFFPTIHFGRVRGFFIKNKHFAYSDKVASIIANIVCYNGALPQGAPTSPIVANFIAQILDNRLAKVARKHRLTYTRYADDLTFSTNDKNIIENYNLFLEEVNETIIKSGFAINEKKVRMQYYSSRQTVTGLLVNKKINIPREYYKKTKAMAHSLYVNGSFIIDEKNQIEGTVRQLDGRFAFINQISRFNNLLYKKKKDKNFTSVEKQYQRFLFYRYFFSPEKPVVITEGKTDILYLKAALMKEYEKYPVLIQKHNNKFKFNLVFLKTNKILKYYFDFNEGGTGKNTLYKCFNQNARVFQENHGLMSYFQNKLNKFPTFPLFFLFDNEMNRSDSPIINFLKLSNKNKEKNKIDLNNNLIVRMRNDQHVYALIHENRTPGTNEEIECLFDEKELSVLINGKKFSTKPDFDTNLYYGKEYFARRHVLKNYKSIDFSRFYSLLDNIVAAINAFAKEKVQNDSSMKT